MQMNFRNVLVSAFAIAALAGCSGGNDTAAVTGHSVEAPAIANNAEAYTQGTPYYTYTVDSHTLTVDGVSIDDINSDTFNGYPSLAANVPAAIAFTKAVETSEQSLELWTGDSLDLAYDLRMDPPAMIYSRNGFMAESVSYVRNATDSGQGQGMATATVTFHFNECLTQQEQGQDQGQDQGKDKGTSQGSTLLTGDQGQGQEKGQSCKTAVVTLNLTEVEAPKGQDQGQDQSKGTDQGKDQGQNQSGDQSKSK
jgi:hypothetical protein